MKRTTTLLTFLFMLGASISANSQTFKASATTQEETGKVITHISGDKLGSDNYEIAIFLAASQETIDEIEIYSIEQAITINGKMADADRLWISYNKSDGSSDFLINPSLKCEFDVAKLIEMNSHLVVEKGNKLSIQFLHKESKRVLGTFDITFDIPGFNNPTSDFCQLLDTRSDDAKVDATLQTMFKLMYPHDEIIAVLMDGEWGEFTDGMGNIKSKDNTYMIIFKYKGKLWSLKYSASYVSENGVLQQQPRVKIYNGLDDPTPVNDACWNALKAVLK